MYLHTFLQAFRFRRTHGAIARMRHLALWWWVLIGWMLMSGFLRAQADDLGPAPMTITWEDGLFGALPSAWMQQNVYTLWDGGIRWAMVIVHGSWFLVPWFLAPLLVTITRPERLGSLIRWMIGLNLAALLVFAVAPVRPPWMADPQVARILEFEVGHINDSNPYAAMPSMHVALPFIVGLWFLNEKRSVLGAAMLIYTAVVGLEVVASGEHYVADVAAAVLLSSAVAAAYRFDVLSWIRGLSSPVYGRSKAGRLQRVLEPASTSAWKEQGQALIELALILPLMLVFILALVDFGIAIDHRQVLQHAVRDGVRYGAVGNSVADVKAHVVDQSIDLGSGFTTNDVEVCYVDENGNGNPGNAGDSIRVTATYTYSFSVGSGELLDAFGVTPPSITMDPSAKLRLEQSVAGATACP